MLVLPGTVHLCKCTLVGIDNELRQPKTAQGWQRLQQIYIKAEAHAGEFPVPSELFGCN
jgi:hypothetical protein